MGTLWVMVELHLPVSRAVVISLPGSNRRPGFLAQPLAGAFEVAEAFRGSTQDWGPYFDAGRFAERYGRPPLPGQIGCAVSHAQVIRQFAVESGEETDLLLVAEDDARFTVDFPLVLRALASAPLPYDVVVLADGWGIHPRLHVRRMFMGMSQLSLLSRVIRGGERSYRVGRLAGQGDCTGLYLFTRRGARLFDAFVRSLPDGKLDFVSDAWSLFRDEAGLDVAFLRPSLVTFAGVSSVRPPDVLAREAEEDAVAPPRTFRTRVSERVAVRSRLRASKLAVRATVEDLRFRRGR